MCLRVLGSDCEKAVLAVGGICGRRVRQWVIPCVKRFVRSKSSEETTYCGDPGLEGGSRYCGGGDWWQRSCVLSFL